MTSQPEIDYSEIPYRDSIIKEVERHALKELEKEGKIWNDMLVAKWTNERGKLTLDIDTTAGSVKNILYGLRDQLEEENIIKVVKEEGKSNVDRKVWVKKQ